ncbi:MAG: PHP domain-containing protein [Patescibacteria group bacterium]
MKLKASLHLHTAEDLVEGGIIKYDIYRLIDEARESGFKVLALTCHKFFVYKKEYGDYAKRKGMLLIPGVEASLRKKHVLILNADKGADKVKSFKQLAGYKKKKPDILVIAAHPNFGFKVSMGIKLLKNNIDLFDAIENSWFYSRFFNLNKKVKKIAQKYNKPMIATADLHDLRYLNGDYAIISAPRMEIKDVLSAIKNGYFVNVTSPKNFFKLASYVLKLFSGR